LACSINDPEIDIVSLVDFILQLNPDLHHVNEEGHTALHVATSVGNIDVINKLIDEDFNVDAKAPANVTPLSIALKADNTAVIKQLLQKQCKVEMDQLSIAASAPTTDQLQIIQEFYPYLQQMKDSNGQGILHFVKYLSVTKYIVNNFPDSLQVLDDAGYSPAMKIASKLGSEDGQYKEILNYLVNEKKS
jgi:ankyrin repeat protein